MDQAKIGKFIGELRKEKKLKQAELAEKLGVTSKTVSRWETGKYMPDLSLFTDISQILGVTINELLQGERLIKKKNSSSIEIEIKLEIEEDNIKNYLIILNKKIINTQIKNNMTYISRQKIQRFLVEILMTNVLE